MEQEKTPGVEETFEALEEIIQQLEGGDSSLEESFKYYETGMKLVKQCTEQIDRVEKQIRILAEEEIEDDEL